jgi:hypothetical protein
MATDICLKYTLEFKIVKNSPISCYIDAINHETVDHFNHLIKNWLHHLV